MTLIDRRCMLRRMCFSTAAFSLNGSVSRAATFEDSPLFVSSVFTPRGGFTDGVEGPACDIHGNLYAVNYHHQGTIGIVTPEGEADIFVELPAGSIGNGIRFDSNDNMFIADYTGHNILRVDMTTKEISVFAHSDLMKQPNDVSITSTDIIFASDPYWSDGIGSIWRIDPAGNIEKVEEVEGSTNGIEVSPDDSTLYINTSNTHTMWAYDLSSDGDLSNRRKLIEFPTRGTDGMRCDIEGAIYQTRIGNSYVAVVSPEGDLIGEIPTIGSKPSNIAFGGPDGCTCYMTMADRGNIETFRTDTPGRSWQLYENRRDTAVADVAPIPKGFRIKGSFPNPFNAVTTIEYTLDTGADMELSIVNMAGQTVDVLRRGHANAGSYSVRWHAAGMPSGMYFVRLRVGNSLATGKITLLK